jgi:hypothetical protein
MAQFKLGAIRQSLYHLIEFGDEKEARKCLELAGKNEVHEIIEHLLATLSLANVILKEQSFGGSHKHAPQRIRLLYDRMVQQGEWSTIDVAEMLSAIKTLLDITPPSSDS